jgi:N-glycosylase/DNA lyase
MMIVAPPYRLDRTLSCGQCFRWSVVPAGDRVAAREPVRARGVVDGAVAVVTQHAHGLSVDWQGPEGSVPRLLRHLGADEPLAEIEAALGEDAVLDRLLPRTSGIALMRQDPWECLVSYVISAFNNIPKIVQTIDRLSRRFGDRIAADAWAFPRPEQLAGARLAALRACLLGYRAPYVRDLARLVARGEIDLEAVTRLPYDDARKTLLSLPGVGEKVAECVLLFGLGHREAFPVDVWVNRAVERWYSKGRPRAPRTIRAWARDRFGPLAGYAQQHLFTGARMLARNGNGRPR